MIYLTLPELLYIAERALKAEASVRDYGMRRSAVDARIVLVVNDRRTPAAGSLAGCAVE